MDTPGGRIHVQWDHGASATPNEQLTFFAEFLAATGVYESWVSNCPLTYNSPNAPSKRDVLGTWLLAILAGHNRMPTLPACAMMRSAPRYWACKKSSAKTPCAGRYLA